MSFLPRPPAPEAGWALFLDVDGTLIEIAPDPEAVVVPPRVPALLARLRRALGGALALVSGRPIATLDALFAPLSLPAGGSHGLERRRADGGIERPERRPQLAAVRAAFADFAERHPGALVEDKGLSVALHFRLAGAAGPVAARLADRLAAELGSGLRVQQGKKVVEIRPAGGDKGSVIEAFMAEPPFAGRIPVFAGDDTTDEDAFAVVNRRGGLSVRIGAAQPTAARFGLPSVSALLDWLDTVEPDISADG